MMSLILASGSPRRFEILSRLDVPFTVVPADVEEHTGDDLRPEEMVLRNARLKAETVAARFPGQIVLAADTTVCLNDRIFNKPRSLDEACAMLRALSGRTHTVFTGLVVKGPRSPYFHEERVVSRVTFRTLDAMRVREYLEQVNPLDKAGAYGIQEGSDLIIERYKGSFTNIMGLPEEETRKALKKFGF